MKFRGEVATLLGAPLLLYGVFGVAPLIVVFASTVYEFGYYGRGFLGLTAYAEVISNPLVWQSLQNSLLFVGLLLPLSLTCIIFISIVVTKAPHKVQKFLRAAYYIPTVSSAMMISIVWRMLARSGGLINEYLLPNVNLLGDHPVLIIVLATLPTSFGASIIILSAGLAAIDEELYDAAKMDGCTPFREAIHITIPSVAPILLYIGATSFVALMQLWQYPYAITGGGPNYRTTTLLLYIYQKGFMGDSLPEAAIMSLLLILIVVGALLLYKLITKQRILQ